MKKLRHVIFSLLCLQTVLFFLPILVFGINMYLNIGRKFAKQIIEKLK
jgi:hypothetical protein